VSKVLQNLVDKATRSKFFNSPGTVGRRRPRLVLTSDFAAEIGDVKPKQVVNLSVRAEVTGTSTLGQRAEIVLEIVDVRRVR
jgi:hypothetical protein